MIKHITLLFSYFILIMQSASAANLAIVIDDFGYRLQNEVAIINLSPKITTAVLPNSPNASRIATYANSHGNDVIIHLPMAPLSHQPLEKDTLFPSMSESEISRIIDEAVAKVPFAIGVNNHMGSLMTGNLSGMEKVMAKLANHNLFFLDSRTIAASQVTKAANLHNITTLRRDIFLDDSMKESDISRQFDLAIAMARKHGRAIAIGHPYAQTLAVLQQKLAALPDDITLVKISDLLPPKVNKPTFGDIWLNFKDDSQTLMYEWLIQRETYNSY